MDEENRRKYDNEILNDTAAWLARELKNRVLEAEDSEEALKSVILDILQETTGISEADWKQMIDANVMAFKIEKGMGMPFQASVNACMYTNFLLGYFMAKNLELDTNVIPEDWTK